MKRYVLLFSVLLSLLSFYVASGQSETTVATVLKRSNLRAGPGTNYAILGKANPGESFTVINQDKNKTWYQLDNEMWIAAFLVYVEVIETENQPGKERATAIPQPTAAPTPIPVPQSTCDSSYPDFCLAKNIPDLDCGEITWRRFRVYQPDPHGFDGDEDGVGCER